MRRRVALSVALGTAALLAVPASASMNGGSGPAAPVCYAKTEGGTSYCQHKVWFHQGSAPKVGNLGVAADTFPTWDTTAPTASVTSGAGGGFVVNGVQRQQDAGDERTAGATFKGAFTGALDTLDVTVHLIAPAKQADPSYNAAIDLVVDGKTVYSGDNDVPLSPAGNALLKTSFVLAGLTGLLQEAGLDTSAGTAHTVELFVSTFPLATTTSAIVYDTTEAPSGMIFNTTAPLTDRTVIGGDPEPEEG